MIYTNDWNINSIENNNNNIINKSRNNNNNKRNHKTFYENLHFKII